VKEARLPTTIERESSLRAQHKLFERSGYDGHSRHSGLVTTRRLNLRHQRRYWHRMLRGWVGPATLRIEQI
jgi:hypothetical protein